MKPVLTCSLILAAGFRVKGGAAFSLSAQDAASPPTRRAFFSSVGAAGSAAALVGVTGLGLPARAAPEIFNTPKGIKYAITQKGKGTATPLKGDIVAIEYTGYLTDGTVFDATHSAGKQTLVFELGGNAVIEGINEMVQQMSVGEKVQAIIPPELAFGDKGICIESGECLVKPKSTLVYDIFLKRDAIPPP